MDAAAAAGAVSAYALFWSAVPLLNKVALRDGGAGSEAVLTWATFVLATLITTAALLPRAGGAARLAREARAALARPVVWAMSALTVAGYLVYFWLIRHLDMHRVALLSPLVLIGTLLGSVAFLGERIHPSRIVGAAIVGAGLVAFFWSDAAALRAQLRGR